VLNFLTKTVEILPQQAIGKQINLHGNYPNMPDYFLQFAIAD
jgi:hypothetical protein